MSTKKVNNAESLNAEELDSTLSNAEVEETIPAHVTIDGTDYPISYLNAKKTTFIMNLLGKLLIGGKLKLKEFGTTDARDLPVAILAAVDEKTLISLAAILIGQSESFVEENFNLTWVLEALAIQVEVGELDKIVRNFTLLVSRIA